MNEFIIININIITIEKLFCTSYDSQGMHELKKWYTLNAI